MNQRAEAERNDNEADEFDIGPTEQEINAWAAREQKRREAWLAGPTDAERRDWARRERQRRSSREDAAFGPDDFSFPWRNAQGAFEDTMAWCATLPMRITAGMLRATRQLDDQLRNPPRRRGPAFFDED